MQKMPRVFSAVQCILFIPVVHIFPIQTCLSCKKFVCGKGGAASWTSFQQLTVQDFWEKKS